MVDYLSVNQSNNSNMSQELDDDFLLKNLIEYYMDNLNGSNLDQFDYDEALVMNIDNLNLHQYILLGWVSLLVTIIGIVGNILTIKILIKPNMKNIVNNLMTGLAISDSISLLLIMFLVPMRYILVSHLSMKFYEIHTLLYPYVYPLTATFQFTSIYLIVVTCSSRMVTVYYPSVISKFNNATCYKIIMFIVIFSSISCIPLWLKFEVDYVVSGHMNTTRLYLKLTDISLNPNYRLYLHIYYIVITYIIPLGIILVMNYLLIVFMLKTRRRKHLLGVRERNELRVSLMLVVFVALFLFCQLPNLFLHIFHAVNMRMGNVISQSYMTQWANFLLIVNSAFNFVIYCMISQTFRDEAKKMFKCNAPMFKKIFKCNLPSSRKEVVYEAVLVNKKKKGAEFRSNSKPVNTTTTNVHDNKMSERHMSEPRAQVTSLLEGYEF